MALKSQTWLLGPSAVEQHGVTRRLLDRFQVPEKQQRIFQSHGAAISEAQAGRGIAVIPEFRAKGYIADGELCTVSSVGAAAEGVWAATSLLASQTPPVASELMRFITTPRSIQAMLAGSGVNIAHFRPSIHVTLWN